MTKRWYVGARESGYFLDLREISRSGRMKEWLAEAFHRVTFERFCCKVPEWAFKVSIGRKDIDEWGFNRNSLWEKMYTLGNRIIWWQFRQEQDVLRVPITRAQALEIDPGFVAAWEAEDDE